MLRPSPPRGRLSRPAGAPGPQCRSAVRHTAAARASRSARGRRRPEPSSCRPRARSSWRIEARGFLASVLAARADVATEGRELRRLEKSVARSRQRVRATRAATNACAPATWLPCGGRAAPRSLAEKAPREASPTPSWACLELRPAAHRQEDRLSDRASPRASSGRRAADSVRAMAAATTASTSQAIGARPSAPPPSVSSPTSAGTPGTRKVAPSWSSSRTRVVTRRSMATVLPSSRRACRRGREEGRGHRLHGQHGSLHWRPSPPRAAPRAHDAQSSRLPLGERSRAGPGRSGGAAPHHSRPASRLWSKPHVRVLTGRASRRLIASCLATLLVLTAEAALLARSRYRPAAWDIRRR